MGIDGGSHDEALVEGVSRRARIRGGIPDGIARDAERATLRWLGSARHDGRRVGRSRVAAYFWAVVKRRALGGEPALRSYRARCLADTLAADMLSAGHEVGSVVAEISRVVGQQHAQEWAASVG